MKYPSGLLPIDSCEDRTACCKLGEKRLRLGWGPLICVDVLVDVSDEPAGLADVELEPSTGRVGLK